MKCAWLDGDDRNAYGPDADDDDDQANKLTQTHINPMEGSQGKP